MEAMGIDLQRQQRDREREYPLFAPVLDWQVGEEQDDRLHHHQELEFRFFSTSSSSAAMIWADEIFSNGKMLPCDVDLAKDGKNLSSKPIYSRSHAAAPPPVPQAAAPPAAINRSSSSPSTKKGSAVVATTTCSSHWKEIFQRLRIKQRSSSTPTPCYESSGSLSSTDTSSSSRQLLLLHEHRHGELVDSSMEPLIDHSKRKNSSRLKQRIPPPGDKLDRTSLNSSRSSHSSSRMMRVSSFDGRSSSRVYPGNGNGNGNGGADHQQSLQTSRRSFSKDHPHRRSLSSFLYDQQQQQHHIRHQSVTPVLHMPACMGDSFVVVSTSSSSSSGKLSKVHSKSRRKT